MPVDGWWSLRAIKLDARSEALKFGVWALCIVRLHLGRNLSPYRSMTTYQVCFLHIWCCSCLLPLLAGSGFSRL
jgi:hypothetical protein